MLRCVWMASMMAGALAASSVQGQFLITPGGASAGNGVLQSAGIPTSLTGTGLSGGNFRAGGTTSTDNLFQFDWWFRVNNDPREYVFGNASVTGGPTCSGALFGNNAGTLDTGGFDYTVNNPTGSYSFSSRQRYQIFNDGVNGVQVLVTHDITNTGATALLMNLFFYQDFDLAGTVSSDSAALTLPDEIRITDGGTALNWSGHGAPRYQVTAFATLRSLLADTGITNLNNTGLPFGPGDFTGAFQWPLTVPVGGSGTITSAFTLNGPALPPPAAGCPCEFDGTAGVNVFDLLAYLSLWFPGDPGAELDGAAGITVFDLLEFLSCWFPASSGVPCP